MRQVTAMIASAASDVASRAVDAQPPDGLQLPLIRLRVEHSGFETLSNQRFGASFVGKVANPHDILGFIKRRARDAGAVGTHAEEEFDDEGMEPGDLADLGTTVTLGGATGIRMDDLVTQELRRLQFDLQVLQERRLLKALTGFAERDEKDAIRGTSHVQYAQSPAN